VPTANLDFVKRQNIVIALAYSHRATRLIFSHACDAQHMPLSGYTLYPYFSEQLPDRDKHQYNSKQTIISNNGNFTKVGGT